MTRSTRLLTVFTATLGATTAGACTRQVEPRERTLDEQADREQTASVRSHAPMSKPGSAQHALPTTTFKPPEPWRPTFGDGQAVAPPDVAHETWRAFVNQAEPMQKQTPAWQEVPAKEVVTLAMPAESRYRCLVNPLEVLPEADDFGSKLEHWLLKRTMVCSSDDFATWTSYPHRVHLSADGSREVTLQSEALLKERATDGSVRELYVLFRSDREVRTASKGAPRILGARSD